MKKIFLSFACIFLISSVSLLLIGCSNNTPDPFEGISVSADVSHWNAVSPTQREDGNWVVSIRYTLTNSTDTELNPPIHVRIYANFSQTQLITEFVNYANSVQANSDRIRTIDNVVFASQTRPLSFTASVLRSGTVVQF